MEVKRTERGWREHLMPSNCQFRRNTLIEFNNTKVVVYTTGAMKNMVSPTVFTRYLEIAPGRHYETHAFIARLEDEYFVADLSKEIKIKHINYIAKLDAAPRANNMHEAVVNEITDRLLAMEIE